MKEVRGNQKVDSPMPEGKYQVLEKYTINLTKEAAQKKLDPVVGPRGRNPPHHAGSHAPDEK